MSRAPGRRPAACSPQRARFAPGFFGVSSATAPARPPIVTPFAAPQRSRLVRLAAGLTAGQFYILARMPFEIVLAPEAVEDLGRSRARVRAELETHLRHEPEKTGRSRIKRLRGLRRPQYRLRVGEVRVFYDVSGASVEILAIVAKSEAESWLAQFGNPE